MKSVNLCRSGFLCLAKSETLNVLCMRIAALMVCPAGASLLVGVRLSVLWVCFMPHPSCSLWVVRCPPPFGLSATRHASPGPPARDADITALHDTQHTGPGCGVDNTTRHDAQQTQHTGPAHPRPMTLTTPPTAYDMIVSAIIDTESLLDVLKGTSRCFCVKLSKAEQRWNTSKPQRDASATQNIEQQTDGVGI